MNLYSKCMRHIKYFQRLYLEHIRRDWNAECDALCKGAASKFIEEAGVANISTLEQEINNITCEICSKPTDEQEMILCDFCSRGFHIHCLGMGRIPKGMFFC